VTVVAEAYDTRVFIGNGQPLVLGLQASQLTTTVDPLDPERTVLSMRTGAGTMDLSRVVSGGTLGGLLDWRSQMLDPARNELGRIGVAIAGQVNAQHREGMDLTGAMGGNFFNIGAATARPATANTGTSVVTVTRDQSRRTPVQRLRSRAHRDGIRCAAGGYGRGRRLHSHRHQRGSDSCRRLVHRRGRWNCHRRPVRFARRAMR
jgi:flagellar hook-associated protein FlgK